MPEHIYSECCRLRCLGTAVTNAKAAFVLTDGDLRGLPRVDKSRWVGGWGEQWRGQQAWLGAPMVLQIWHRLHSTAICAFVSCAPHLRFRRCRDHRRPALRCRGALGTAHIYRLVDLLAAAQRKHGGVEGMVALVREKAGKSQQRKRSMQDAAAARRQALAAALAELGSTLT